MAQHPIVSCPGCGKRYSVPPGAPPGQFPCQDCGSVVVYGVKGEPAGPPPRGHGSGKAHARAAAAKRRHQRERGQQDDDEEGDRRSRGPVGKSKAQNPVFYLLAMATVGCLVAGFAYLASREKGNPPKGAPPATASTGPGRGASLPVDSAAGTAPGVPALAPVASAYVPKPAEPESGPASSPFKAVARSEGLQPKGETFKEAANPPAGGNYGKSQAQLLMALKDARASVVTDLGHLPDTSPDLQGKIDSDVAKVADPNSGSEGIRAQDRLIKIGRPAIPRVLAVASKLDFAKFKDILDARDECTVADAMDNVLRSITEYDKPPKVQYSPQFSKLVEYQQCIEEWYLWWLTVGYRRETFYRKADVPEDEKL